MSIFTASPAPQTAENLRKAFTEHYGVPPSTYRRTQRSERPRPASTMVKPAAG